MLLFVSIHIYQHDDLPTCIELKHICSSVNVGRWKSRSLERQWYVVAGNTFREEAHLMSLQQETRLSCSWMTRSIVLRCLSLQMMISTKSPKGSPSTETAAFATERTAINLHVLFSSLPLSLHDQRPIRHHHRSAFSLLTSSCAAMTVQTIENCRDHALCKMKCVQNFTSLPLKFHESIWMFKHLMET